MGLVISTVNMKGGVGKTSLTVNLATSLAKNHGKRVLIVDLDSQISATLSVMVPHEFAKIRKKRLTLSYLIDKNLQSHRKKKFNIQDIIYPNICNLETLDLLPGDIELYDEYVVADLLHKQTVTKEKYEFKKVWENFERILIKNILDPVRSDYDFIIMDCAPGYNLLTRSGLCASDFYLLPSRPEPLSLVGIQLLEKRIAKLKENHLETEPIKTKMLGIVFILSGGILQSRYYNQVMKRVTLDYTSDRLFQQTIPMDFNVAKALDSFMPAVLSNPNSSGAKAFVKLTDEFLAKCSNNH